MTHLVVQFRSAVARQPTLFIGENGTIFFRGILKNYRNPLKWCLVATGPGYVGKIGRIFYLFLSFASLLESCPLN